METTLLAQAERDRVAAEARGQAGLLHRQLRAKFRALPPSIEERLKAATSAQLEYWAERMLTAQTLEQVFSDH